MSPTPSRRPKGDPLVPIFQAVPSALPRTMVVAVN
jgi:hypothetical protein